MPISTNFQQEEISMSPGLRCALSLIIAINLGGCATVTQKQFLARGDTPLNAKQLQQLVTENYLRLESIELDAKLQFQPNGRLTAQSHGGEKETGKWKISPEDHFCLKFDSWYYGDLKCYTVIADGAKYVFFGDNGARSYTATPFPTGTSQVGDQARAEIVSTGSTGQHGQAPPFRTEAEKNRSLKSLAKNCPGCNFRGADLTGAQLIGADLTGTNLSGADLSDANLRRARLAGANLAGARLLRTNLLGADLQGSNLRGADLTGANLIGANVTGAELTETVLTGAHLESIQGLTE